MAQSKTDEEFRQELGLRSQLPVTKLYDWFERLYSSKHWVPVGLCLPFALRDIGVQSVPQSIYRVFVDGFTAEWLVNQSKRLPLGGNCGMAVARSLADKHLGSFSYKGDFSEILKDVQGYVKRNSLKECFDDFLRPFELQDSCLEEMVGAWVVYSGDSESLQDCVPATWSLLDQDYGNIYSAGQLGRKTDGEQKRAISSKLGDYKERAPGSLPSRMSDLDPMEVLLMNEAPFLFDYKSACSELTQTWRELDVDSNSRPSVLVEIDVSFGLAQCVLLDGELSYADLTRAAVLEFVRFMLKLVHHEDWMVTMIVRSEGPLGNEAVVLSPEILEELSSELSSVNAFRWLRDRLPAMFEYDVAGPEEIIPQFSNSYDGHIKLLVCDDDKPVSLNQSRYQESSSVKSTATLRPAADGKCSWEVSHSGRFNGYFKGDLCRESFLEDSLSLSRSMLNKLVESVDSSKESANKPLSFTVGSYEH